MADTFQPIRLSSSAPAVEDDRAPLFYIDDREYTVPKRISGATALQALDVFVRTGSEEAVTMWLARHAIGEKGIEDLFSCPQLTSEQARALMDELGRRYIGQMKELAKQ